MEFAREREERGERERDHQPNIKINQKLRGRKRDQIVTVCDATSIHTLIIPRQTNKATRGFCAPGECVSPVPDRIPKGGKEEGLLLFFADLVCVMSLFTFFVVDKKRGCDGAPCRLGAGAVRYMRTYSAWSWVQEGYVEERISCLLDR